MRLFLNVYIILFSCLFSVVFVAQILSFLGIYIALFAIPLTIAGAIASYWIYKRIGRTWQQFLIGHDHDALSALDISLITSSIIMVIIVFVQRMVLWSASTLGLFIPEDFIGYHSVKALDLLYSGSSWNLAIPYGQYPFGYESLITFGMMLIPNINITGTIHALIFVLFWMTIALLIMRYSRLPLSLGLIASLAICFTPVLFPQILNVGKNDILLSLTVLMAVLHAPVGDDYFHPLGLAFATMLSLATKATGLYILFYLWGLVLLNWYLSYRKGTWQQYLHPFIFVLTLILMFPGGLWVIRNYVLMGELFTSEISAFFQTSIGANLDNPVLYSSPDSRSLLVAAIATGLLSILSLLKRELGWQMAGLLLVTAITFIITPLSAFLTADNLNYMDVQWRFVLHGIILLGVVVIVLLAPFIVSLYQWLKSVPYLSMIGSFAVLIMTCILLLVIGINDLFSYDTTRWQQFYDPTFQPDSIYDEVVTLEPSTIYIEGMNWLPIMLSNPDLTITELRYPLGNASIYPMPTIDYVGFIPSQQRPEPIANFFVANEWEIIFEDDTGRLYRRIP